MECVRAVSTCNSGAVLAGCVSTGYLRVRRQMATIRLLLATRSPAKPHAGKCRRKIELYDRRRAKTYVTRAIYWRRIYSARPAELPTTAHSNTHPNPRPSRYPRSSALPHSSDKPVSELPRWAFTRRARRRLNYVTGRALFSRIFHVVCGCHRPTSTVRH